MNRRKLLRRLNGMKASVFSNYDLIARGFIIYDGGRCFVDGMQIPLCSMRNVAPWNRGSSKALIFVDQKYSFNRNC